MNTYVVLRRFPGHEAGETLRESDFIRPQRAQQLMAQRYIALAGDTAAETPATKSAKTKKEEFRETHA